LKVYKKLAGNTVIYGLGTIIPRILNYIILTSYYTRVLSVSQFGIITELYGYMAFLLILLTYGTETGYFKFSQGDTKNIIYSSILGSLLYSSAAFIALILIFSKSISAALSYQGNEKYIILMAVIVAVDAFSAIPFARLRKEEKSRKFALLKILNVIFTVVAVMTFYEILPWLQDKFGILGNVKFRGEVLYVFISNLIASALILLLLMPDIIKQPVKINGKELKKVLAYSFPLLIAGLAGTVNEALDKVLMKHVLSEEGNALYILGIYGANYRIAQLVYIFIQMFRFAVEPFYFNYQGQKDEKLVYANIMRLFIGVIIIMCMLIMFYLKYVSLLIPEKYHEGLSIIPILLSAFLFYGIFFNQSVWYKLTKHTGYAILLTAIGAIITIIANLFFVKRFSYYAAAFGHLFAYMVMTILSFFLGRKYYKIDYRLLRILEYIIVAIVIFGIRFMVIHKENILVDILSGILIILYGSYILKREDLLNSAIKNIRKFL